MERKVSARDKEEKLTEGQKKFCEYYASCHNKTAAYRLAYPQSSYTTAAAAAAHLLKKYKINAYVEQLENEKNALIAISNDRIIKDSVEALNALITTAMKTILIANGQLPDPRDKNAIAAFSTRQTADIAASLHRIAIVFFGMPDAKMRLIGGDAIAEEIKNRIAQGEYYFDEDAINVEESSLV
jgi:hypothetical protein